MTEFFSQRRTDANVPTDNTRFDVERQGVVYRFNVANPGVPQLSTLAPTADTTFRDSNDAATGCFPNQLYAATVHSGRVYITALCESPRGPVGPAAAPSRGAR